MRLIIAITGASGSIYGIRLLEFLKSRQDIETHLISSKTAESVILYETDHKNIEHVKKLADYCHQDDDLAAPVSSGLIPYWWNDCGSLQCQDPFCCSSLLWRKFDSPRIRCLFERKTKTCSCLKRNPFNPLPH